MNSPQVLSSLPLAEMTSSTYYLVHSSLAVLVLAVFYLSIGVFVGWLLWRHCREAVARIERENEQLVLELEQARNRYSEVRTEFESLSAGDA